MPVGRPSKLTENVIKMAQEYLADCKDDRKPLPTMEGLSLRLGLHRDTMYGWEEAKKATSLQVRFSDIVKELKQAQAEKLIQLGLSGKYNPSITKLILSGKHGYVEKSEIDQTLSGNVSFMNDVPRPKAGDAKPKSS